jgi:hypothetical protein
MVQKWEMINPFPALMPQSARDLNVTSRSKRPKEPLV